MGLFPYQTPEEAYRQQQRSHHYERFVAAQRRVPVSGGGFAHGPYPRDGKRYATADDFFRAVGWYPLLAKGGECYGWAEAGRRHGYVEPLMHEIAFLKTLGYEQHQEQFSDEPHEDCRLGEKFYLENGWIPRWTKNGHKYGHEQLLAQHDYQYPGDGPPYVHVPKG